MNEEWAETTLGSLLHRVRRREAVSIDSVYPAVSVTKDGAGLGAKEPFVGGVTNYSTLYKVLSGDVVVRTITAFESPVAVAQPIHDGTYVSQVFLTYEVSNEAIPNFLGLFFQTTPFWEEMRNRAQGTVLRRKTISDENFLGIPLSLPPLPVQRRIVDLMAHLDNQIANLRLERDAARAVRVATLSNLLDATREIPADYDAAFDLADSAPQASPTSESAMNDDWQSLALGDVAVMYQPKTLAKSELDEDGPFPVFGANGLIGYHTEFNHLEPQIAVTCRGATCGTINWTPPTCWITGNAMVVAPLDERLSKSFLFYALQFSDIETTISGSAQPQITRTSLTPLRVPVPPLPVQRRIVDLMAHLDNQIAGVDVEVSTLESLRRQLLASLLSQGVELPASYDLLLDGVA